MSVESSALALHEILLSISDSLNEAQLQLRNMPPYDEYGRPNTIYQLPYLDFNLEVISQFDSVTSTGTNTSTSGLRSIGNIAKVDNRSMLKFVPYKNTETGNTTSNKIVSNISGRFVAVLPNEGLPQVYLNIQSEKLVLPPPADLADPIFHKFKITVKLQQATEVPVEGQRVEMNFDTTTSFNINGADLNDLPVFTKKEGRTDTNGEFITEVTMSGTDYDAMRTIVLVANSSNIFSSAAISKV